jgi:hypothetical protein
MAAFSFSFCLYFFWPKSGRKGNNNKLETSLVKIAIFHDGRGGPRVMQGACAPLDFEK